MGDDYAVERRSAGSFLEFAARIYCLLLPLDILPLVSGISIAFPATLLLLIARVMDMPAGCSRGGRVYRPALVLSLSFAGWALASTVWSVSPRATVISAMSLVLQIFVMMALVRVMPWQWRILMRCYALGATLLGFLVLVAPPQVLRQDRASVGGIDENVTAFVLTLGAAAAVATLQWASGPGTVLAFGEVAVMTAAVLHGGSRTGMVALAGVAAAGVLYAVALDSGRRATSALRSLVALVVAVAAFQFAKASGLIPQRVLALLDDFGARDDSGRAAIVAFFRFFQGEWFWWGIGYGADAEFLQLKIGRYENVHSLFWATWVCLGIVGVVILGALLVACLRNAMRLPTRSAALLMAVPVMAFALTLGGDRTAQFWFVLALGAGQALVPTESGRLLAASVTHP